MVDNIKQSKSKAPSPTGGKERERRKGGEGRDRICQM